MLALHFEDAGVSAVSMTVARHPERSWGREATPPQSKNPGTDEVNTDASRSSVFDVFQNASRRWSGERDAEVLRLRSRCASRIGYFAQDDTETLAKRTGHSAQDDR